MMDSYTATESYLNLLLKLPQLHPMTVLAVFFLTLARILPIVTLAPFLGSKNLPGPIRLLFGITLVAFFLPQNLFAVSGNIFFTMTFIGYLVKELLIGFILGFMAAVPFYTAQMAGSLIDFQRGASSLQVSDPTTQTQTGPIGLLCNFLLIALFYTLGGPFIYLGGVADSYVLLPATKILQPDFFHANGSFASQMFGLAGIMMRIATQLAAPALIGVLFTDLFLGIANRLAPQVQIVFLGIALKSWVGLALMTAAWALMIRTMGENSIEWMKAINQFIQSFRNL